MSDLDPKKISDLRVVDLKVELEKRGLDKNGVKKDLVERLQKALQTKSDDSKTDVDEKKSTKRTNPPNDSTNEKANQNNDTKTEEKDNSNEEIIEKSSVAEFSDKSKEDTLENDKKASDLGGNNTKNNEKVTETVVNNDKHDEKQDKTTAEENVQDQQASTSDTPDVEEKKNEDEKSVVPVSDTSGEETTQQKKSQSNPRLLWISNVPKNTRANEIKQLLSTCGKVICAKVVVNARFPGSCCFGYVTMGSAEDATNVITKLNNTEFDGHIIKIDKFENVKADTLNPSRKKSSEEQKRSIEKKEEKPKKLPENKLTEKLKNDDKGTADQSSERRKSLASEHSSSRGRIRTRSRERLSKDRIREREREHDRNASHRSDARHRANVLTFDKIKEERERQRMRDRERALREDNRRRHEEAIRIREMRYEAERLEREREKLRMERDKIEKEKTQLIKLEKERQRIEREKLEMEKMELERTRIRLEEDRRAVKRPMPINYRHDHEEPFDDRKRMAPEPERHFERPAPPRFDAPSHGSAIPPKKFGSKDYNKRTHEGFPDKRGPDFNSERIHQGPLMNRSEENLAKYNRSYDDRDPGRDLMRLKDNRYNNVRERSPQFRQMTNLDRHISSGKPERKNFEQSGDRWNQPSNTQQKFGGSSSQNQWSNKGTSTWRLDPPTDRWASSNPASGRSAGQYSGNSKFGPACPPPPGINSYEYGKPTGGRRY